MTKIALIGFKNSGKTSLGKSISMETKIPFCDTDEEICLSVGIKSIRDFFETDGKKTFIKIETQIIKKFSSKQNIVIATGGAFCENMEAIATLKKNNFVFIFVNTNPAIIFERIKQEKTLPYFLKNAPKHKIEEKFFEIYKFRTEKYTQLADIITIPLLFHVKHSLLSYGIKTKG